MFTTPKPSTEPFSFVLLRSLLNYDPSTGALVWRERPSRMFLSSRACNVWNANWAGRPAFTARCANGYASGAIFGKTYRGHRIAMSLHLGRWLSPTEYIDHMNGDRADNRAANLRIVDRQQNMRNIATPCNSTSGRIGVSFSTQKRKWRSYILGKHIGYFETPEDAAAARGAAEAVYGFNIRAAGVAKEIK